MHAALQDHENLLKEQEERFVFYILFSLIYVYLGLEFFYNLLDTKIIYLFAIFLFPIIEYKYYI